jgi:hypothetical protein
MKQFPKAIPELDGGLFLPRQVVDLLEVVLDGHERLLEGRDGAGDDAIVLAQLRELLRMTGPRPSLPPAREQLGLADPQQEVLRRNLVRG